MATGKGGKKDPQSQAKESVQGNVIKASHIKKMLKKTTKLRVSKDACKAVSAVLIYIISEIMDGARNIANADGKKKILPKHVNFAISKDSELDHIGHNWMIKNGGVKSNLLPQDIGSKKNKD